ncbi:MAG: hypothetical protein OJF55_000551 [Rhodanobacteraceae bacterium]|nr:MAG: hypothetical protein OJF55_000551 [Rhodanobacteraceae bacterium]
MQTAWTPKCVDAAEAGRSLVQGGSVHRVRDSGLDLIWRTSRRFEPVTVP